MFLKFLLFVILCMHFHIVQGQAEKNTLYVEQIARQYLFMGDIAEISIFDLEIPEESKTEFPKMMIIVMIDKTLGYNIDSFFPYFYDKPVFELNAASTNQNIVLAPSSAVFEIDFRTETLTQISSSIMVHLYPNSDSIVTGNKNLDNNTQNRTQQTIKLFSSNIDGNIIYNLSFLLSVESAELEGLYKLSLLSDTNTPTMIKVSIPWHNVSVICHTARVVAHFFIFAFVIYRGTNRCDHELYYAVLMNKPIYSMLLLLSEGSLSNLELEQFRKICVISSDFSYLILILSPFVVFWMRWKVFHIFVWVICIHAIIQENENSNMMVHSYITIFPNLMVVAMSQVCMIVVIAGEQVLQKHLEQTEGRYHFVYDCSHIIFVIVVSFQLILASMISLGLPFHLFWVEFAIEEILCVLYLYYVIHPNLKIIEKQDVILRQQI